MRCTLPIRQNKATAKPRKRNRKIQKKKSASKKIKKCRNNLDKSREQQIKREV